MKEMSLDLGEQKKLLIEEIHSISDVELIESIREMIQRSSEQSDFEPMRMEDYLERIEFSRRDIQAGNVVLHEDLGKEIEEWKNEA